MPEGIETVYERGPSFQRTETIAYTLAVKTGYDQLTGRGNLWKVGANGRPEFTSHTESFQWTDWVRQASESGNAYVLDLPLIKPPTPSNGLSPYFLFGAVGRFFPGGDVNPLQYTFTFSGPHASHTNSESRPNGGDPATSTDPLHVALFHPTQDELMQITAGDTAQSAQAHLQVSWSDGVTVSVDQPFVFAMPRVRHSEQGPLIDHNLAGGSWERLTPLNNGDGTWVAPGNSGATFTGSNVVRTISRVSGWLPHIAEGAAAIATGSGNAILAAGLALTNIALRAIIQDILTDPSQVAMKTRDEAEIEPLYVEGGYEPGRSVSDYYWTLEVWKKKHRFFASVDAYSMEGYQGTTFIEDFITDKAHEAPYRVMRKYKYGGRLP